MSLDVINEKEFYIMTKFGRRKISKDI